MHLELNCRDHDAGLTAPLIIGVFVTSLVRLLPLSACLEQRTDLVVDQIGDVSHLVVCGAQFHHPIRDHAQAQRHIRIDIEGKSKSSTSSEV